MFVKRVTIHRLRTTIISTHGLKSGSPSTGVTLRGIGTFRRQDLTGTSKSQEPVLRARSRPVGQSSCACPCAMSLSSPICVCTHTHAHTPTRACVHTGFVCFLQSERLKLVLWHARKALRYDPYTFSDLNWRLEEGEKTFWALWRKLLLVHRPEKIQSNHMGVTVLW